MGGKTLLKIGQVPGAWRETAEGCCDEGMRVTAVLTGGGGECA